MKDEFTNDLDRLIELKKIDENEIDEDLLFSKKILDLYDVGEDTKAEVRNKMKDNNKKKSNLKRVIAVAAALVMVLPFTTFGQGIYRTIREAMLPSGRVQIIEEEKVADTGKMPVPEGLKGKLFDENGALLEYADENTELYNENGEKIVSTSYDEKTGEYEVYTEEDDESYFKSYDNLDEYIEKLAFNPLVLSDKYQFISAEEIISEDESSSEYAEFIYKIDGKEIKIFERVSSDENGYATGGENLEEFKIDGVDVIYHSGDTLEFERDGILGSIRAKASKDEMTKIFKDLKLYR